MAPRGTATVDTLFKALVRSGSPLDADERAVALALYRLLGRGRPVELSDLAHAVGTTEGVARSILGSWSEVFYESDRVIAFWGLDLRETAHRFEVDGRRLFTWCAWDPLFIAPILGGRAKVESWCPVTDRIVTVSVGPHGVGDVYPPESALSFMEACCSEGSVITGFCQFVLLFASSDAARQWVDLHPGTTVISLQEGFELGRRMNRERLGLIDRSVPVVMTSGEPSRRTGVSGGAST